MPIFSMMGYSSSKFMTSCLLPPTWSRRIAESGLVLAPTAATGVME